MKPFEDIKGREPPVEPLEEPEKPLARALRGVVFVLACGLFLGGVWFQSHRQLDPGREPAAAEDRIVRAVLSRSLLAPRFAGIAEFRAGEQVYVHVETAEAAVVTAAAVTPSERVPLEAVPLADGLRWRLGPFAVDPGAGMVLVLAGGGAASPSVIATMAESVQPLIQRAAGLDDALLEEVRAWFADDHRFAIEVLPFEVLPPDSSR